ncbi:MAG: thioredoxin [Actinomycetota bacterium]|jgi:putative thioredoxin|nr:thioredoxin [Euzebyaceae bacterium]MDQ3452737.1 thioredoxin [Actinomycetota bacterium]
MSETTLHIANATDATFEQVVIAASRTRPVVVDFWAAWCGPCRQLSPLLERVAARHVGEVDVVKVDVDANPDVARRYRIQGIPAVKAFRDGQVAAEFTGLQPEAVVGQFFEALAPSVADRLAAQADEAEPDQREALLGQAVAEQADHPAAVVALATILAERDDSDEAARLLRRLPADPAARRLLAELHLREGAADDIDDLRRQAATGGQPRLRLGRALAANGDSEEALEVLITAVRDPDTREGARSAVLELFAVLGDHSELVRAWRPKLASALF